MLQIITGRFFSTEDLSRTRQRTILYTNYRGVAPIETAVGTYLPASVSYDVADAVYEVEQRLEAVRPDGTREVVVAVPATDLARDFAALVSFCLRVTCSLDRALVSRLTQSGRPPIGVTIQPARLVDQVFDQTVHPPSVDAEAFSAFLADLVQLERVRFVRVMRAIRRYVVGLHRIGDDLPIAYTLLVASIESLAQSFDRFDAQWRDLDDRKRRKIDSALKGATGKTREAVRNAILDIEHMALGRRYREFAMEHLPASYFRGEAIGEHSAARASELPEALSRAYAFRSSLVHRLEELPGLLVHASQRRDVMMIDGRPVLTFQGLARLTRRVILRFVELSPKLEEEEFNYREALPNVVRAPMAPQYWIGRRENYHSRSARQFLSGFLSQLESVLLGGGALTDIRDVLEEVEQRVPGLSASYRRPMLALYLLYHQHVAEEGHRPNAQAFMTAHMSMLDEPSIESLVCHVVLAEPMEWELGEIEKVRRAYHDQRYHKTGLILRPVLEAALTISSAEAHRVAGETNHALELMGEAVVNLPGHEGLLEKERQWAAGDFQSADWRELLLPKGDASDENEDDRDLGSETAAR